MVMRFRSFALLSVAVALMACGTDETGPTGFLPTQPTGRFRFVHAISDPARASAINVTVDGVPVGVSIVYAGTTPTTTLPNPGLAPATLYYPAYAGNRQLAVRRTADTTVRLLDAAIAVAANADHTVLAVGGATISALVLTDDNTAPAAGNVKLRAVNAATAAGNVDVYVTAPGAAIAAIAPTFAGVAPRAASGYLERAAGAIQVRFTTAGTKTVIRDVSLGTLAAGTIRTVVLLEAAAGGTPLTSSVLTDR
jgi:trimeric autotransporter adhesin